MTTYADPVFPLPEPSFLWVHDLIAWQTGASVTVGAGRKWRHQSASAVFTGYVTAPDPREQTRAGASDLRVDAVVLAPLGTDLDHVDQLEVPAAAVNAGSVPPPPILVGRYAISAVRPNPSHVRVLLSRWDGEDPAHAG